MMDSIFSASDYSSVYPYFILRVPRTHLSWCVVLVGILEALGARAFTAAGAFWKKYKRHYTVGCGTICSVYSLNTRTSFTVLCNATFLFVGDSS